MHPHSSRRAGHGPMAAALAALPFLVAVSACDDTYAPSPGQPAVREQQQAASPVPAPLPAQAASDAHELEFRDQVVATCIEHLRAVAAHPAVVDALVEAGQQSRKSQDEILAIDEQWRQASGADDPLIAPFLSNACALYLKQVQKEHPAYGELFVMDSQGCIVGESNKTSDYWQGDEAKWIECFQEGQGREYVSDIEYDQSTQAFVVQISLPVRAPGGAMIGAMTVSVMARKPS
ncbi:MAG: hypothetical protein HY812_13275 [Planctomycetes bacterium]|nr:hypothetical protein [Planctomycetota bacterium]